LVLAGVAAGLLALTVIVVAQWYCERARTGGIMDVFSIEIAPAKDATAASVHTVVVTIDDHETVLTFDSEEKAKAFVEIERARLTEAEAGAVQISGKAKPIKLSYRVVAVSDGTYTVEGLNIGVITKRKGFPNKAAADAWAAEQKRALGAEGQKQS
jgi:uncharacterized protein (UPF0264 family)